ncbi:hypothetical protein ACX0GZ_00950 [Sphingomonas aestuarii]
MISIRALPILGLLSVAGCQADTSTFGSCAERFAKSAQLQVQSDSLSATYGFDLSALEESERQSVIEERKPVITTVSQSGRMVEEWKAKKIDRDEVLINGDQMLAKFKSGTVANAAEAVSRGCALEPRHGRLQSLTIDFPNPRMDVTT